MLQKTAGLATIFNILALALVPAIAHAQRGPVGGVRIVQRPIRIATRPITAPRVSERGIRTSGIRFGGANRPTIGSKDHSRPQSAQTFSIGGGLPLSIQDLLGISPQYGFNWQYVNAINQDLPIKALIDPVTQLQVAQAVRLLRLTNGAFPAAAGGVYYWPPETEEPPAMELPARSSAEPPQSQVIVLQQAPVPPPQHANEQGATELETPDQSGLVLVLRNGKQIQVSAFTHARNEIVYIAPDGNRLSVPDTDLDSEATLRANKERGNFLQIPF